MPNVSPQYEFADSVPSKGALYDTVPKLPVPAADSNQVDLNTNTIQLSADSTIAAPTLVESPVIDSGVSTTTIRDEYSSKRPEIDSFETTPELPLYIADSNRFNLNADTFSYAADSTTIAFDSLIATTAVQNEPPTGYVGTERPHTFQSQSWVGLLMLIQFLLYAYAFVRFRKFWSEKLKELFKGKGYENSFSDSSREANRTIYLSILCVINLTVFLFLFIKGSLLSVGKTEILLAYFVIILIYVLTRLVIMKFLSYIFFYRNPHVQLFKEDYLMSVSFLGFFFYINVLFLTYIAAFTPQVLFIAGFSGYLLFVLLTIYLLLKHFCVDLYSFLYLILYLCILEILPATMLFLSLNNIEQNLLVKWITKT